MKNSQKTAILLSLLLLCTSVYSLEYYANLTFDIQQDGTVLLSGNTNDSSLTQATAQELTSKIGKTWIFSLSKTNYAEYSVKIIFPQNTKIQKIETAGEYIFQTENMRPEIELFGEKADLNANITYTTQTAPETVQPNTIIGLAILLLLVVIGLFILKKYNIALTPKREKTISEENTFDPDVLTQRQLDIVKELEKRKGKATQAEIQKELLLPKASVFRNIKGLEKKGIIQKERKGMTMLLTLKKNKRN